MVGDAMENTPVQEAAAVSGDVSPQENEQVLAADCKIVTFSLGGKGYAIDIMRVKEIVKAGRFTYVPNTAPFVLGVYNLRGDIIPILDLRLFFNLPVQEEKADALKSLIILTVDDQDYGVVVDSIDKVVAIYSGSIQPPHPIFGDINIRYIQGVVENQGRLYILLDAARIFKEKEPEAEHDVSLETLRTAPAAPVPASAAQPAPSGPVPETPSAPAPVSAEQELSFIRDSLAVMSRFYVSQVNEDWVRSRFREWTDLRGGNNLQLHTPEDASLFLSAFASPDSGTLWSDAYMKEVSSLLPDNTAKQINVWDIGCGKGFEAYSVAVMLRERYPGARVRIYANDVDLLAVSGAPLLTVPEQNIPAMIRPYLTKNVSGALVFIQEIRDMILFEYHDCANQNSLPSLDFVVCRDVLSFMEAKKQSAVIADIAENLKGNGLVLLGMNESMPKNTGWQRKEKGKTPVFVKE